MTYTKKLKTPSSAPAKKAQFNLATRENHADYSTLIKAKELFALLAKDSKISRAALLLKLVRSFSLTGDFTPLEKQLVNAAAEHEGISIEEFGRRAALLYANKILSKQTIYHEDGNGSNDGGAIGNSFVAKAKSKADLKVDKIVTEMMQSNDNALSWQDKREITARSVNDWGKHANTNVEYKTINQIVLKRYFTLHRDKINQHHQKHNIKPDHNRRAVAANNKALRQANQERRLNSE